MITQPKILETQFAILMADGATGHVLNVNGEVHLSDNSEAFLIFDNLDLARKHNIDLHFHPFIIVDGIPSREFRRQKMKA